MGVYVLKSTGEEEGEASVALAGVKLVATVSFHWPVSRGCDPHDVLGLRTCLFRDCRGHEQHGGTGGLMSGRRQRLVRLLRLVRRQ